LLLSKSRVCCLNSGTSLNERHIFWWRKCGKYCISLYIKEVDKGKNNVVRSSQMKLRFQATVGALGASSEEWQTLLKAYIPFVNFINGSTITKMCPYLLQLRYQS